MLLALANSGHSPVSIYPTPDGHLFRKQVARFTSGLDTRACDMLGWL